jgi:hypothetical protein
MNSENLGKTLACGHREASGSANSRLSLRQLLAQLDINHMRSAVSADRMIHSL